MEDGALGVAQGLAGLQVHEWRLAAGRVHRGHEGFEWDRALRRARRRDALRRQRGEAGHGERVLGVDHAVRPMMVRQRQMTGGVAEPLDFAPLTRCGSVQDTLSVPARIRGALPQHRQAEHDALAAAQTLKRATRVVVPSGLRRLGTATGARK